MREYPVEQKNVIEQEESRSFIVYSEKRTIQKQRDCEEDSVTKSIYDPNKRRKRRKFTTCYLSSLRGRSQEKDTLLGRNKGKIMGSRENVRIEGKRKCYQLRYVKEFLKVLGQVVFNLHKANK